MRSCTVGAGGVRAHAASKARRGGHIGVTVGSGFVNGWARCHGGLGVNGGLGVTVGSGWSAS